MTTTFWPLKAASPCGLPSTPGYDAAHSASTALPAAGALAGALPPAELPPRTQWPAASPPAIATAAITMPAKIPLLFIGSGFGW
ncbi:hypothetical protein DM82_2643 [Burkholderia oklahomensis]|uniref:Uncharacterized protein n=1 Tax=Burkholderia oklahomensis TaxID=342113 RepID=A0AAI8B4B1_9BURK|nr:hypothetical protein DM82_2643 [Burkholderia oklahomensis]